ncbi:hypothetical protein R3W88_008324 [Solanum pinnatisectum]|uniref:Uncharacterized protein n=1 Tax=Solanum pinnatisectum TaxID=50273 RepID=A0AAV9M7M4_9SOLN|nr:hypothetical protein R3W88_008324 [Solanum pinnatisectum]
MAVPHVLIFPLPLQGPVNCMLKLAELLCLHQEIHVTFINTEYIHHRLLNYTDVVIRFAKYPNFKFVTVPDGLPEDNLRNGEQVWKMIEGVEEVSSPLFREMVMTTTTCSPTCLIVDGNDLDALINSVAGMEGMRRRDLPSFCRATDLDIPIIQHVIKQGKHIVQPQALILNTFEALEGPILSQFRALCPNIYAIEPLHTLLNLCQTHQLLFVSIGSLATMSKAQFLEFWYGLVNSKTNFLWVQMPGSIIGLEDDDINVPMELVESTKERGCIVSWAPQEEVLAQPSIGGFLTHLWGMPMICLPYFVDQQVNSRMKDVCDRATIETMVIEVMDVKKIEFLERAKQMSNLAIASVGEGGASYQDLERLIEDITFIPRFGTFN